MPKPIRVELDETSKVLRVGNQTYRLAEEIVVKGDPKKAVFKPISQKQWNARIARIADYLVNKSKVTARDIIKNALNEMDLSTVSNIEKTIAVPKRPRVRVQDGCMSIVVGKFEVPLI